MYFGGDIVNRFCAGGTITVHDELLMDLYKLNTSIARFTIKERIIGGKKYLVNSLGKENKYEVGLVVPVPDKLEKIGLDLDRISNPVLDQYYDLYKIIEERLRFSAEEILIADILFNDYLNNSVVNRTGINQITFRDIERYRGKSSVERCEVIKDETFERYKKIITSLCSKTIFLKTTDTFRNPKYGVNNKEILQPFLDINAVYMVGVNNYQFNYSFGNYGKFIRRSRRYSNLLPSSCYSYNFNQKYRHCVDIYLAQFLFYARYKCSRSRDNYFDCIIEAVMVCEWVYGKYNITSKEFNKFRKYALEILQTFQDMEEIEQYELTATLCRGVGKRKKSASCKLKLLNAARKSGNNVDGLILPLLQEDGEDYVSYPNISSYALFKLPAGSEE